MAGRLSADAIDERLNAGLETYVSGWGPIQWREDVADLEVEQDDTLSTVFSALANIEDDAFYMNVKLRHAGALRRKPVEQFYSIWSAEESEHARVLTHLAMLYGSRSFAAGHSTFARDRRSVSALLGLRIGRQYERGMVAGYMALGMVQEFIAITVYNALTRKLTEPTVRRIMRDIIRQEGRHMRFYSNGASALLIGDPIAQRFVRFVLSRYWRPPGIDLYGFERWNALFSSFLDDPETIQELKRLDRTISELPGLNNLRLMQRFLDDRKRRVETPLVARVRTVTN